VFAKQFGALAGVGMGLDATEFAVLLAELDGANAGLFKNLRDVARASDTS